MTIRKNGKNIEFCGMSNTECLIPYGDNYVYFQIGSPTKITIITEIIKKQEGVFTTDETLDDKTPKTLKEIAIKRSITFEKQEGVFTIDTALLNDLNAKELKMIVRQLGGFLIDPKIYNKLKRVFPKSVKGFSAKKLKLNDKSGILLQTPNTEERKKILYITYHRHQRFLRLLQKKLASSRQNG